MLAFGLTAEIGFQAVTNMAVSIALLPTKGLTLPFVSFGGSSLVTLGLASGILLNISKTSQHLSGSIVNNKVDMPRQKLFLRRRLHDASKASTLW